MDILNVDQGLDLVKQVILSLNHNLCNNLCLDVHVEYLGGDLDSAHKQYTSTICKFKM